MVESQRRVLSEKEILNVPCPNCHVQVGVACRNSARHVLVVMTGQTELSFHSARIFIAQQQQMRDRFGILGATEKALICYYAFVMLCDSVSTKSIEVIGKDVSSQEIQAMFVQEAIKALRNDKLIPSVQ